MLFPVSPKYAIISPMWRRSKVGGKLLGVTLISLLMALVGLLLVLSLIHI